MPVIRWPHQPTISRAAMQFIEAAQLLGEQVIVLSMYHVSKDEGVQPRCSVCYDEVYKQSGESNTCTNCYGTTFEGGVKSVARAWAIPGDKDSTEDFKPRGVWEKDTRSIQIERYPDLEENDYLVRVVKWGRHWVPEVLGARYRLDKIREVSLRTGARFNQTFSDRIAQLSDVSEVDRKHVIYQFPVPPTERAFRDPRSPIID